MFSEFATIYKDDNNQVHLYIFPGIDDDGKQLYRNMDLNNINIDYTFVKNSDKSYDFVFKSDVKNIRCSMISIKSGEVKTFSFVV